MALRAMGFTALPLTPPYVVFFSLPMLGQALPLALSPMRPDFWHGASAHFKHLADSLR